MKLKQLIKIQTNNKNNKFIDHQKFQQWTLQDEKNECKGTKHLKHSEFIEGLKAELAGEPEEEIHSVKSQLKGD